MLHMAHRFGAAVVEVEIGADGTVTSARFIMASLFGTVSRKAAMRGDLSDLPTVTAPAQWRLILISFPKMESL